MLEYYRDLELTLVSGLDIGPGGSTGRPEAYAKVSLRGTPGKVYQSNVDTIGGTNPIWNFTCCLEIRDSSVREPGVEVEVKLYYRKIVEDLFVGEVHIPIPALFDRGISASAAFNVVPTGSLNISFRFGEKSLKPYLLYSSAGSLSAASAILLSLPDSEEKGMNKKMSGKLNSVSKREDSFSRPKEYTVGSPESPSEDLIRIKEMTESTLSSLGSSSQDLRAERKEMTKSTLSSLESSSQDLRAERKEMTKSTLSSLGSSSQDLRAERKEMTKSTLGSLESSSQDLRAERKEMTKSTLSSLGSSSQNLRAERKEMTKSTLSSLESSSQNLRAERKEMNDVAKSDHYKIFLEDFILFCSVFPLDYEFTKDVLVWQWIARRWIEWEADEEMDEVCMEECINTLVDKNYIIPSGYDYVLDQTKYKIGDKMTTDGKYLDIKQSHHDPTNVELLSLTFKEIDHAKVKQYSRLHTLVIHDFYEADHLPSDLFSGMKSLKILNLSRTSVVELPSSVEDLKELRFLDMSNTPLVWLCESICSLTHLQTLKLDGCLQLEGLPKGTGSLINLRHLILDVVLQLESMPVGLGKLSNLQTLSAFMVGEEEGCSVTELKDMNKLRGTFRLLNLENVRTKEEASEACLCKKVDLKKIELQWSDIEDERIPHEEEILQSLKPGVGIQELKILFYSGGVLPSWICDPSFEELVTISLYKCRYCVNLSSLGKLPSLKHLSIIENKEVVEINTSFCSNQRYCRAFPKLEKLTFESMSRLERCMISLGDLGSLRHLIMEYCPKLVELHFLRRLLSLTHLEIRYCPELSPNFLDRFPLSLPLSLQSLMIKESPRLKEWFHENRNKVAGVPTVYFDHEMFPPEM